MKTSPWAAVAVALLLAGTALAATPAQDCASRKNKEAGKYVQCREKAQAKFVLKSDPAVLAIALQKCADKLAGNWTKIESAAGGACPTQGGLPAVVQFLDTTSADVATALAGGPLVDRGHRVETGQKQCWGGSSNTPIACPGTGRDGEHQKGLERLYVDNGDGTISDVKTGLTWEKLAWDGGIHDRLNQFSWPDAYAYKVAALNTIAFAGHTDWRLPNVNELLSIIDYGASTYPQVPWAFHNGCVAGCTVLTCSCGWNSGYGGSELYWTSTTYEPAPFYVWTVGAYDGSVRSSARNEVRHVRAVRGGS